jgi:hypothetical protein
MDDLDGEADVSWAKQYVNDLGKVGIKDALIIDDKTWPPELAMYFNATSAQRKKALGLLAVLLGYEINPTRAEALLVKNPKTT